MKIFLAVPNLNYGHYLDHCLKSIEGQEGVSVTVFVVDGGSSDNSQDVARVYCERNDWRFIVKAELSQSASINFAFNEFCSVAEDDDLFGWLNSDDIFLRSDALALVKDAFSNFYDLNLVSFGGCFVDKNGDIMSRVLYAYHPLIKGDVFKKGGAFLQPSTFWQKKVWVSQGINEALRYTFDADFLLRSHFSGYKFLVDPNVLVSGYRIHGENLSLNVPVGRVGELAVLYRDVLGRPYSSTYLVVLARLLAVLERVPKVGPWLKTVVRLFNNALSYLSVFRVPSI